MMGYVLVARDLRAGQSVYLFQRVPWPSLAKKGCATSMVEDGSSTVSTRLYFNEATCEDVAAFLKLYGICAHIDIDQRGKYLDVFVPSCWLPTLSKEFAIGSGC